VIRMPLIYESSYSKRPFLLFNSYLETLYPYFTTKVCQVAYQRERLELHDGDFLDLDWIENNSNKLVMISHGFEGNSKDHFVEKSASFLTGNGFDVLVWHYRSCGGEINRLPRLYHHGDIQDLADVVDHAIRKSGYQSISLLGFSMGGNLVVNYLGSNLVSPKIKGGIIFSTPLDLVGASQVFSKGFNRFLEKNFFKKLARKLAAKADQFPKLLDREALSKVKSLSELYEKVVLPLHGFPSLKSYYDQWSSQQFLPKIDLPLLIVNAQNDPLLSESCYLKEFCQSSDNIYLEMPKYGGHTGFTRKMNRELWYLWRIKSFIIEKLE